MSNTSIQRIAVFTSGGDAPGMNAAIRAVVRTASYHHLDVFGIYRGYQGLIEGDMEKMGSSDVGNIMHRGGTVLKTARSKEFMTPEGRQLAYQSLLKHQIDACVAIGGNGTFTGAKLFTEEFNIPIIGVPGTIDNDLYGSDFTIGFDTAINTAMEAADKIRDTADSHNRLFFVEVMGRHSGFIAVHSGIGSGAGGVMIPEVGNSLEQLFNSLEQGENERRKKKFSLIIVAEGNKMGGATEIARLVKEKYTQYDTKVTIIGHLQRGGSPTCSDRVLASRLGHASVEALIAGQSGVMVGIVDNKIQYTPFEEAIYKEKPINKDLLHLAEVLSL